MRERRGADRRWDWVRHEPAWKHLQEPSCYKICVCVCWQSVMDKWIPVDPELSESEEPMAGLSASEFSCHCCYEVLVEPTTLTCGHSFCRHCLATWWASTRPSVRTDCPECRAIWQGYPEVNILLRWEMWRWICFCSHTLQLFTGVKMHYIHWIQCLQL